MKRLSTSRFILLIAFCLPVVSLFGQDRMIDRNGDPTFLYYGAQEFDFSMTSADGALKVSYTKPWNSKFYYVDGNQNARTVTKSDCISGTLKFFSTTDYFFLTDLTHYKPAFKLEVGYQNTIDVIDDRSRLPVFAKAVGAMFYLKMDNTSIYDTTRSEAHQAMPLSVGLTFNSTIVKSEYFMPAFNVTLERTWNKNDLDQYQRNSPVYQNSQIVVLDDFEGLIGSVENRRHARVAVSVPSFLPGEGTFSSHFSMAPYYVLNINEKAFPTHNYGFSLNFFKDPVKGPGASIGDCFGIAIDFEQVGKEISAPQVFIYGTISFSGLLPAPTPKSTPARPALLLGI
jgi:hypothetical protein